MSFIPFVYHSPSVRWVDHIVQSYDDAGLNCTLSYPIIISIIDNNTYIAHTVSGTLVSILHIFIQSSQQPIAVVTVINLILQMRKMFSNK